MNERDWERYRKHVAESDTTVQLVAKHLLSKGYTIQVPPAHVAANQSDRRKMMDEGDLFVLQRMEVKGQSIKFTGLGDYPYKAMIVCNRNSFDNHKGMPPAFYFIVSADNTTMAVVDVKKTKERWWSEQRRDSRYEDVVETYYFINLKDVTFVKLNAL